MTIEEAISKIRVMLGSDSQTQEAETTFETEEKVVVELEDKTLVDGTKVMVEGTLEPGNTLLVEGAEGEEPQTAPQGIHQTTDDLLIEVDENGVIISVEPFVPEATSEEKTETTFDSEALIGQISELLTPFKDEINSLKEQISKLDTEFSDFKSEPAGKKITNNLEDNKKLETSMYDAKMAKLYEIRKNKFK